MRFFTTAMLLLVALTSVASAKPAPFGRPTITRSISTSNPFKPNPTSTTATPATTPLCLDNSTASYLVSAYASLLTAYTNTTAKSVLSPNFTDTSDSINWIAGLPLGGPTFPSRAAFIAGQGTQPPLASFTVVHTIFTCTEVSFRWIATLGSQTWPAKGINMFTAAITSNPNNSTVAAAAAAAAWQIQNMYSEFNVGAWEVDIGRACAATGANV